VDNPFEFKARPEQPYRRVLELTLVDKHTGKTVRISHDFGLDDEMATVKQVVMEKVDVLFDACFT
jgi:hypothetical protein